MGVGAAVWWAPHWCWDIVDHMVTGYTKNNLQQFWKTLGPCWAAVCAAANVVVGLMASHLTIYGIELNLETLSVIFFCSGVEGFKQPDLNSRDRKLSTFFLRTL